MSNKIFDLFHDKKEENLCLWGVIFIITLILFVVCLFVFGPKKCFAEELTASFYSVQSLKAEGTYARSHGIMADGSLFRDDSYTCACNSYPLGVFLTVTNRENAKTIIVKNTDRTARRFKGKRIDLTPVAMEALGGKRAILQGLIKVSVKEVI